MIVARCLTEGCPNNFILRESDVEGHDAAPDIVYQRAVNHALAFETPHDIQVGHENPGGL